MIKNIDKVLIKNIMEPSKNGKKLFIYKNVRKICHPQRIGPLSSPAVRFRTCIKDQPALEPKKPFFEEKIYKKKVMEKI